ncbi:MAG: cob(I)yrinic acid a,c-diamide adenosyltransferase [Candidatus Omnitrophota bacterium]
MKRGYTHIYTGGGKGKTTAGMGLAVRAAVSGLRVCVFQFLKKRGSSADNTLSLPRLKVVCFDEVHPMFCKRVGGRESGVWRKLKKKIEKDFEKAKKIVNSKRYDVVMLDEILNCVSGKFLDEKRLLALIKAKPPRLELVLTGRGATKRLVASSDYVTRFSKIKHPFDRGIAARKGIEY